MLCSSGNIPYQEYRAIDELMGTHPQKLKSSLKALIAFGEIVATGGSQDINLLEIVAGWQGPRYVSYGSPAHAILLEEPYDYGHDIMAGLEGVVVVGSPAEDALDQDPTAFLQRQTVAA